MDKAYWNDFYSIKLVCFVFHFVNFIGIQKLNIPKVITVYINKNIDLKTFGNATSPSNPDDLNIETEGEKYEDVILYLRNEISRLRKFIGFDQIDTLNGETGKYELNSESSYLSVFGYEPEADLNTNSKMTCLLDYIKQFASAVKVYEGILAPETSDITFDWVN